ncbi:MAG: DUF4340 domain-containing protein [Treponema sp.]|jgi:hypothetical protein|nr:DUF4340 domain-containing protein [Treponema sp.]
MIKKLIFIAAMILALGALALTLFILNKAPAPDTVVQTPVAERKYILDFESSGEEGSPLVSLRVENSAGGYTVLADVQGPIVLGEDSAPKPALSGWEEFTADTYLLNRTLNVSSRIEERGVAAETPENLGAFGLDKPRAAAHIRPVRGEEVTILVGNPAPDRINCYVMKQGDPAVYLAYGADMDLFVKSPLDFLDKTISPAAVQNEYQENLFAEVVLGGSVRQGEDLSVRRFEADPAEAETRVLPNTLRMLKPMQANLNMDKASKAFAGLFGLSATRIAGRIENPGDLANWGLDKPYSTAAVTGIEGEGNFSLRVSAPTAEGNVYIQREGLKLVFEMPASSITWLTTTWFDIMDRIMVLPFIDHVAEVDVISREKTVTFRLSGEGDDLKVMAGDTEVNESYFRTYYQTLLLAMYDELSPEQEKPKTKPVLEIVYRYRDGRPGDRVTFWETNSRRSLSCLNGGRLYYTMSVYIDKVLSDLEQVLKGEKTVSYI